MPARFWSQVTVLTSDHRWTSEEERARLAGMGIQLEGRTRLYGLNLSRCLGDKFLKVATSCSRDTPHRRFVVIPCIRSPDCIHIRFAHLSLVQSSC